LDIAAILLCLLTANGSITTGFFGFYYGKRLAIFTKQNQTLRQPELDLSRSNSLAVTACQSVRYEFAARFSWQVDDCITLTIRQFCNIHHDYGRTQGEEFGNRKSKFVTGSV